MGLIGLGGLGGARADIDLPTQPPPQPIAQTVRVFAGETVEIPLAGLSRTGLQLRFLVRTQPSLGRLGEVRTTGRSEAVVVYEHVEDRGTGMDGFRYAVQAPNSGVSTPAEVRIQVVEREPVFVVPARVDFPTIAVGEIAVRTVELRNDGGGTIAGRITLPEGWSFPTGDGSYVLGPNESQEIAIRFEPDRPQTAQVLAGFTHDERWQLGLNGVAFAPVETTPVRVALESRDGSESRSGRFTVRNLTDVERVLEIAGPEELVVQEAVTVGPLSEIEVAVNTRAGFLGAMDTELTLTGDAVELRMPVQVFAAPAKLVTDAAGGLDFGNPETGETVTRKVVLRNVGGSDGTVAVVLVRGVTVTPEPTLETIPVGGEKEFEVAFFRTLPGEVREELVFSSGASEIRIPLRAEVKSVLPAPEQPSRAAMMAEIRGVELNDIPAVQEIGVTRQTKRELDLIWDLPAAGVERFVLMQRKFEFGKDGKARIRWDPLKNVRVEIKDGRARAFLTGLRAGEQVTISIIAKDAAGKDSEASPPFTMATLPGRPLQIPWIVVLVGGLALCVGLIVRERLKARARAEADVAAMDRRMRL